MKQYDTYKASGLDWLGDIPEHWSVALLTKTLFSLVDYRGKTPRKLEDNEDGLFLVTARNVKNGKINYSLSEEYVDYVEAKKLLLRGSLKIGDVLFTTEAPLGEVANIDRTDIALAQRIIKFSGINSIVDNYYLKYWIFSNTFQSILKTFATGSTVVGIKGSKIRLLNIILPSLYEQNKIANYIDVKTTAIDSKIELLSAKADKYKALRRSVINETVCRGLNPNVPLKDSGIEWIGMIPEHWEVKRFKDIANSIIGLTYSPDEVVDEDEGILVLRSGNIQNGELSFNDNVFVNSNIGKNLFVKKGDILLCSRNGSANLVGKSAYIDKNYNYSWGAFMTVVRSKMGRFLFYALNSDLFKRNMGLFQTSTVNQLTSKMLDNMAFLVPSKDEQIDVVNYLDEKTTQIDTILTNIGEQINMLTQLRKTLINDVVTGQLKVTE